VFIGSDGNAQAYPPTQIFHQRSAKNMRKKNVRLVIVGVFLMILALVFFFILQSMVILGLIGKKA
jgi:hypothetical protein